MIIKGAWEECRQVFGKENILVVGNSAGTRLDPGGIQVRTLFLIDMNKKTKHDLLFLPKGRISLIPSRGPRSQT